MNSKTIFYVLLGLVVVMLALAGLVAYQGGKVLTSKGDEIIDKKLQNQVFEDREQALVQAKRDIEQYSELEAIAKAIVPQEKDQARTVREISAIAQRSGIPISSFQFPASALGQVQRGKTKKPTASNPATSQLIPVEGTKGLYAMEIVVQSDNKQPVSYGNLLSFLERLEQNRRTAHVTNLTINPEQENRNLINFSVTLNVYIKL
jgi:hypothetical protein